MSLLKSDIERNDSPLFFSIIDYQNNKFLSKNANEVMEFYEGFRSVEDMVEWMKSRPKGKANIREISGNKNIVVVIPTIDANGEHSLRCKESIFHGLQLIFVESGVDNNYFNYAHNVNIGIKIALKYNPHWIICSNDDMYKIDDINVLVEKLSRIDNRKIKAVFVTPSAYHSYGSSIGKKRPILSHLGFYSYNLIKGSVKKFRLQYMLWNRYKVKWLQGPRNFFISKIFLKAPLQVNITSSFSIFSGTWCNKVNGQILEEGYINGVEDWELSLKLSVKDDSNLFLDYRIGDMIGTSFGNDITRSLRDVANIVYFNQRITDLIESN